MLSEQPCVTEHIGKFDFLDGESGCCRVLTLDELLHADPMDQLAVRHLISGLIQVNRASAEGAGARDGSADTVQFLSDGVDQP